MSVNYQAWKSQSKSVGSLFLDPENPRIPPGRNLAGERAVIAELVTHEDVYALAKNIIENGFFPSEPLVAVVEDSKHYVVEGNRRLAACKLLVNPNLAPPDDVKKFRTLAATFDIKLLSKLPIVVAPSREATIPLIIARHTATQVEKWKPAMQAHFYSNLLSHGVAVDEVAEKFGLKPSQIREAIVAHNLYKMACRLDLPDKERGVVSDPRHFNLTTLGRIFDTPFAKEFFGVDFQGDGTITGKIPPEEFEKGFSRIVSDIANGSQTSRTLETAGHIKSYLTGLPTGQHPNTRKKGSFDSNTFLSESATAASPPPTKPSRKPRGSGQSVGLFPRSMVCGLNNQRVKNLLHELQKLSPAKFPNASAFTLRSFLEISVYCFLNDKGEISIMQQEYLAEIKKRNLGRPPAKQRKPEPNWTPNLSAMMARLVDPQKALIKNRHTSKALAKVIREEAELFGLNLLTHNSTYHPTETRLRAVALNLEEFFKEILE